MNIYINNFSFKKETILKDINLTVRHRERISISGQNGCGKSTLLNIICGKLKSDTNIENPLTVAYYGRDISLNTELSLANHWELFRKDLSSATFQALVKGLNFETFYTTKIKNLSQGNTAKAHLIFILSLDRELYILDEPTENMDESSVKYLSDFIRKFDKSCILVSHDKNFVGKTCETHYMINEKTIQKYEFT